MADCLEGVVAGGDVGEDVDVHPVAGDRRSAGRLEQVAGVLALPVRLVAVLLAEGGIRVDHDDAFGSVNEDRGAVGDVEHVMTGADHGRYAERSSEDGAVGDWAAGGGDDAEHRAGVESGGLGRRQVSSHEDAGEGVGGPGSVSEQVSEDLVADRANVAGPGLEVGIGEAARNGRQARRRQRAKRVRP